MNDGLAQMAGIQEAQESAAFRDLCLNEIGPSIRDLVSRGVPRTIIIEVLAELSVELYEPFA